MPDYIHSSTDDQKRNIVKTALEFAYFTHADLCLLALRLIPKLSLEQLERVGRELARCVRNRKADAHFQPVAGTADLNKQRDGN